MFIETIYVDGNRETHFDPISDSIKIYRVIFTSIGLFALSGILSFAVDILFFNIIISTFTSNLEVAKAILMATIFARIISSIVNYNFNKNIVFKEGSKDKTYIIKYYCLWLFILIASWLLVTFFTQYLLLPPTLVKVFVDAFLFIISFQVQRLFIFRKRVK